MVSISIGSDLHLEHSASFKPLNHDKADVLVLAGDIMVAESIRRFSFYDNDRGTGSIHEYNSQSYQKFLEIASKEFDLVVMVAGNHEHYNGYFDRTADVMIDACSAVGSNVVFLNDSACDYAGLTFVGGTLWTDMNRGDPLAQYDVARGMNDYSIITANPSVGNYRKLRASDTIAAHRVTRDLIHHVDRNSAERGRKTVVVTHHAPSYRSRDPRYNDSLVHGYCSALDEMVEDCVSTVMWCHGHIHSQHDYMIGDTRIIANPRGYPGEMRPPTEEYRFKTVEIS